MLEEGKTFTFETVLSSRDKVHFMKEARRRGYRAYIFDNSGSKHKLLVEVNELADEGSIKLHTSRLNPWFVNTELWRSVA